MGMFVLAVFAALAGIAVLSVLLALCATLVIGSVSVALIPAAGALRRHARGRPQGVTNAARGVLTRLGAPLRAQAVGR